MQDHSSLFLLLEKGESPYHQRLHSWCKSNTWYLWRYLDAFLLLVWYYGFLQRLPDGIKRFQPTKQNLWHRVSHKLSTSWKNSTLEMSSCLCQLQCIVLQRGNGVFHTVVLFLHVSGILKWLLLCMWFDIQLLCLFHLMNSGCWLLAKTKKAYQTGLHHWTWVVDHIAVLQLQFKSIKQVLKKSWNFMFRGSGVC